MLTKWLWKEISSPNASSYEQPDEKSYEQPDEKSVLVHKLLMFNIYYIRFKMIYVLEINYSKRLLLNTFLLGNDSKLWTSMK